MSQRFQKKKIRKVILQRRGPNICGLFFALFLVLWTMISLRGSQELREVDFVSSCCLPAWDQTLTKPVARKDSSKANQPRDGINIRELWSERPFTNSPQFGALSYYFQQIFETNSI